MDCAAFRQRHLEFVDGTMDALSLVQAELHRSACAECGRLDTRLRRGLMVAHHLPPITPSGQFAAKLAVRLAGERQQQARHQRVVRGWVTVGGVCALAIAAFAARRTAPADTRRFVGSGEAPQVVGSLVRASGPLDADWPHSVDSVLPPEPVVVTVHGQYGSAGPRAVMLPVGAGLPMDGVISVGIAR